MALKIAAGSIPIALLACGQSKPAPIRDVVTINGTGGSTLGSGGTSDATSQPGSGGALTSGGMGAGGSLGSGGMIGAGGESGAGGPAGTGGATGTGGQPASGRDSGVGGRIGSGGATVGSGGATVGSGGATVGSGGAMDSGGVWASDGGIGTGGVSGTGGKFGAGGGPSTGGASGSGGSSAAVTFSPRFVGNIDDANNMRENFATQWDQFTPENAGKWAAVQGSGPSTFNWNALDALYKYAEDHNILFKEDCFVWGASQPSWMGGLTTTTGPAAVRNWMKAFCDRYPKTRLIDVVNEPPPHTTPAFANVIGGGSNTTWDWIANSFKWAREACPNAVLILNDYNNAEYASDAQHTVDIVNAIKKLGAPINGVGCQAHDAAKLPASTLKANIDNIASATGLPVYITQYDIDLADDDLQKQKYEEDFSMFWNNPNVKGVTVWGYIVGHTWRTNTGIMQSDGTMRPAMSWLMAFLGR